MSRSLIPPPRVHRHRYHGVLAPNAALRERVVTLGRDDGHVPTETDTGAGDDTLTPAAGSTVESPASTLPDSPQRTAARSRCARLLARIYEIFPLLCPDCGGDMRIIAFITAAEPVDAILAHLGLPTTPPPLSPARGPPQHDLGFDIDQTPTYDRLNPSPSPSRTSTSIRAPAPETAPRPSTSDPALRCAPQPRVAQSSRASAADAPGSGTHPTNHLQPSRLAALATRCP